jgi:regulator of PEP synthase PpsR (kinase-PPPase family)
MPSRKTPTVFIVSDGRGDTATQVAKAAAVQFEGVRYQTARRSHVSTPEQVRTIVREASRSNAVVLYTLVSEEVRKAMRQNSREFHVPSVDLLGPVFTAMGGLFERKRGATPDLLYALDRERIDRMDAIDYTLKHDDGQRPHELGSADVVLVGVSRVSKSTTCFYLAYEGVRAANVPLVEGVDPPKQLLALPPHKVIGLRVQLSRLLTVREKRAVNIGLRVSNPYLDRRDVAREIAAANRLMEDHGWRAVDASYLAVEEIAREVMRLLSEPHAMDESTVD